MSNATIAFRNQVYDKEKNRFLLSRISDSSQAGDLSVPSNCDGFGRIHHFRRRSDAKWVDDPLPIDPACHALGINPTDMVEAQVFQIAACNANCWYCFVPDTLKCADNRLSKWFTADEMIKLYLDNVPNVRILDLSGGNPELAPEWVVETMRSLETHQKVDDIYLWSDDTLTTDFLLDMDESKIKYMSTYPMYGKVCCFKGFDAKSFSFNSGLASYAFEKQFERFEKYLELGFDLYGYVTLTCPDINGIEEKIGQFFDKLQQIHPLLPLRTVPLKIFVFTPTQSRISILHQAALSNQDVVIEAWKEALQERFPENQRNKKIYEIQLK